MATRGRPPKTVAELRLHGTFRPDRHAARAANTPPAVAPAKPRGMTGEASKFWDRVVPQLVERGRLEAINVEAVVIACDAWAIYKSVIGKVKRYPLITDYRLAYRAYRAALVDSLKELGLSPAERTRMANGQLPQPESDSSVSGFARKRV